MTIRKTTPNDLATVMNIYAGARAFMRESGNHDQWKNSHPPKAQIEDDIEAGTSYVCTQDDEIVAVFFFDTTPDPTYTKIDGAWLSHAPYGVVHRIARAMTPAAKGAGAFCLNWCMTQIPNIRIDTHQDNALMIKLLEGLGFKKCGIIWLENGEERLAFQKES